MSMDEATKSENDAASTATTANAVISTLGQTFNEHDKELIVQSQNEYKKRQYNSCLKILQNLLETHSTNTKLLLNKAICEYALSSFKNLNEFRQQIDTICQTLKISVDNFQTLEDPEHCIFFYNYAIVLFHFKQFNKCLYIVEKIYQFIEALDENFAKEVYLLLIDLYTITYQPSKALNLINTFEKQLQKKLNVGGTVTAVDTMSQDTLNDLSLVSVFRLKSYVQMKSFSFCEKEFQSLSTSALPNKNQFLLYLKCYYEYSIKNYSKCLELISFLIRQPQPLQPQPHQQFQVKCEKLYLNNNLACIHFYLKKYSLSTLYLKRAINENSKYLTELLKQLQQQPQQQPNDPVLYSLHLNKKYELLYNLGLIQLFNKQPLNAFDCFIECINKYKTNSRIWLRISECCIMIYRQNDEICKLNERLKCVQKSIGMSIYHKIVFAPKLSKTQQSQPLQTQQPCLEFAYACLKNAYYILTNIDEVNMNGPLNGAHHGNTYQNQADGFLHEKTVNISPQITSYLSLGEFYKLKCSILTSLSFVSLCCYDYLNTIKYCNALLVDCKSYLPKGNKYLAHNYLAEALVYADKLSDAIENLNLNIDLQSNADISFELNHNNDGDKPVKGVDTFNWYPHNVETARAVVFYNLSIAHAIRGEIDLAYRWFDKCVIQFGKIQPANTYFMKIYLDLLDGNRQGLQTLLRDYFGHATISRTYQSSLHAAQQQAQQQAAQQIQQQQSFVKPPATPTTLPPNTNMQFLNNTQLLQQQQLQNLNPSFLQSHPQFLQLAQQQQAQQQQQQQQQQFLNQFSATANPTSPFNLQNAFHLNSQFPSSTNTTPSVQQQQQQLSAFQNLNSSAFNFTTQNVSQLLQQQQQQQQQAAAAAAVSQFHSRIN